MIGRRLLLAGTAAGVVAGALALGLLAPADGEVLDRKQSPYNTIVVTEDEQGLRTLRFEQSGARQSVVKPGDPDHLELAYVKSMLVGLAFADRPQRVLVVGLGGGTIPSFLHKHYPRMTIDVVDIDPDVVEVARQFFGFREDARMRAHVADGRRFIEECRRPYDVIFLDAFGAENVPYDLATREFLQAVRRALRPGGVAVGNIWSRSCNPLYDDMVRTYQDVFGCLYIFDVQGGGNKILVAPSRKARFEQDELALRASKISRQKCFGFDLGERVVYGYQCAEEENPLGRVLRDRDKVEEDP
jgi:spermidine synthase